MWGNGRASVTGVRMIFGKFREFIVFQPALKTVCVADLPRLQGSLATAALGSLQSLPSLKLSNYLVTASQLKFLFPRIWNFSRISIPAAALSFCCCICTSRVHLNISGKIGKYSSGLPAVTFAQQSHYTKISLEDSVPHITTPQTAGKREETIAKR